MSESSFSDGSRIEPREGPIAPSGSNVVEARVLRLRMVMIACVAAAIVWWAKDFRWGLVWENRLLLTQGVGWTFFFFISSMTLGLLFGILLAVGRVYAPWPLRFAAIVLIETVRGIPQLMVIFWVYFTIPEVTGSAPSGHTAALAALTAIAAAYLAEDVRAGFRSVPEVQWESGLSTGLTRTQIFIHIVLPQAVRNMTPTILATAITMMKVTSLIYVVGAIDLFRAMILINNRIYEPYALYLVVALFYFGVCWAMNAIIARLDPKYEITS